MKDALWRKRGNALVPADVVTEAALAAIKEGYFVATTLPTRPRNPKFHRLMMAMLSKVVEHTWPRFANNGELMDWLKLKSGMVKWVFVVDGVERVDFKSVSFYSMDETEFREIVEKWKLIIATELMPGVDPDELLKGGW